MATFDKDANALSAAATSPKLPVQGGRMWNLAAHPDNYEVAEVDGALRWVPALRKIPFIKGVGGIRENGDMGPFVTWLNAEGWVIIGNNPSRKHWLHYADSFPARGGAIKVDIWTTIHQPSPKRVKFRREPEQVAEYDRWRAKLIDEGVVPAPSPIVIDDMIDDYEHQNVRRLMGKDQKPIIVEKLAAARVQLERMKSASLTAPEPAPAKTRR